MEARICKLSLLSLFIFCICVLSNASESRKVSVTGCVVDYNARPVEGAEVAVYQELYDYDMDQEYANLNNNFEKTDVNGCFAVDVDILPVLKEVFIVARKEGFALGWDIFYSTGCPEDKIIILEKPCFLSGTIVNEKGEPVAGSKVRAVPKSSYLMRLEQSPVIEPKQWFTTETDSDGNFRYNNFSADVYTDFWVDAPGWSLTYQYTPNFMSAFGYEAGQTNVKLVLPQEVTVQGKVVDAESGKAVEGVKLYLHPEDIREHNNPYYPKQTISGADGKFSFQGVPPGMHYVNASFDIESRFVDKRIKFEINSDDSVKEVIIEANKGGLIEISVREASTKEPIGEIRAYFYGSTQDENSRFSKDSVSGKDGTFRVYAPPGECKFSIYCEGYSPSSIDGELIMVNKGQTAKREFLVDRVRSISGIVLGENGKPISGVLVNGSPVGGIDSTDNAGKFELDLDPSGPCERLIARHTGRNLISITEIKDISKPVEIKLKSALSITGRVTNPEGIGIPAARLALALRGSGYISSLAGETITDSQGRYKFNAIPLIQNEFEYMISTYSSGYGSREYERISIEGEPGSEVEIKTIVLQPADQSLSGIVVDANGVPVSGLPVMMHSKDQPIRNTVTDKGGCFILKRICKGPLRIQAGLGNTQIDPGFLEAEGIDDNVRIILGQRLIHTPQQSLLGKSLPDMSDLGIKLNDIAGKVILVCFFDYQQRPSRNCLLQLNKRAEELKSQDIEIIAVHASGIEQEKLDEWIKENNIQFPIGMIEAEEEKTRLSWGVKLLPWLILTDKEHKVTAEGFGVTELDEKLVEISVN